MGTGIGRRNAGMGAGHTGDPKLANKNRRRVMIYVVADADADANADAAKAAPQKHNKKAEIG